MRLKMLLEKARKWWKPENATISILDLIWARLLVKLSCGLIYILSLVDGAMSKIQSVASVIRSQARATISLRTIEQIKPVEFAWKAPGCNNSYSGYLAQPILTSPVVPTGILKYQNGTGLTGQYTNNAITFSNKDSKPVLVITKDGDVEWHGKPSEAAEALETIFQFKVEDMKGITKAARRRYYAMACRNILEKAEQMEYKDFLVFLNKQVYNREKTVIMDSLQGEDDAG
jgi:hypothetical protein